MRSHGEPKDLVETARRRIQKLNRRSASADQRIRCRLVLKVAAGLSCNAAARKLGCATSTTVRIVARFHTEGEAALLDLRSENGRHKFDADVRVGVCEILTGSPDDHGFARPTWTLEIPRAVVESVLHVGLSLGSLWALLRAIGARWGRPRVTRNHRQRTIDALPDRVHG
jgi:transposase